jgi:Tfp pilus assembly protein PilZ
MGEWRQALTGRQNYPRVSTALSVRISTVDPEVDPDTGQTFFRSVEETTANISRGGAYVNSWEPLSAGSRVLIAVDLPREGEIQLVGRVAWTRRLLRSTQSEGTDSPGYGVEFVGGSSSELSALDRYLTNLQPSKQTVSKGDSAVLPAQP